MWFGGGRVCCFLGLVLVCYNTKKWRILFLKKNKNAFNRLRKNNSSLINITELSVYIWVAGTPKISKIVKKRKLKLKYFLHDYIKINLAMDSKDGSFNSIAFQCRKVDGIMNKLCDSEQKEEIIDFPWLWTTHLLIPWALEELSTDFSVASKLCLQGKRDLEILSAKSTGLGRKLPKLFSRKDWGQRKVLNLCIEWYSRHLAQRYWNSEIWICCKGSHAKYILK